MTSLRTTPDAGNSSAAASGATAGVTAGLWIRVSTNLSERKVTWRLAEMLRVSHPFIRDAGSTFPADLLHLSAAALLLNLWGKIAEHTEDGVIRDIPDAQLEEWAKWRGDVGAFAAWVRAKHYDAERGTVREWDEFAGALQSKRQKDAERQRAKRERDRLARGELPIGGSARVESGSPVVSDDKAALALSLVIAANKGMGENVAIASAFNPINAGRGDSIEVVEHFLASGIPVDDFALLARFVYTLAKNYTPAKRGDHIKSLNYFRDGALDMWHRQKTAEATRNAPDLVEVHPAGGNGSRRAVASRGRAQRSAVGALAAGEAVGLADDES